MKRRRQIVNKNERCMVCIVLDFIGGKSVLMRDTECILREEKRV
jgi:hypothetical protein